MYRIPIEAVNEPIVTPIFVQIEFNDDARFSATGKSRSAVFKNITCSIDPGIPSA
jgi:hypothetical protein